jgi:hypothetical protein
LSILVANEASAEENLVFNEPSAVPALKISEAKSAEIPFSFAVALEISPAKSEEIPSA